MNDQDVATLVREFESFDTGVVSDALDRCGITGVLPSVRRLTTSRTVVGTAATVQLGRDDGTASTRHLGASAIDGATDLTVIVVAGGLDTCGGWGGLLATAAQRRGVRGVVLEGLMRDVDEAETLGFPVFAHGGSPVTARGRQRETSSDAVVRIDGVTITPGDLVVADGTGVVVVPLVLAQDVLDAARLIAEREQAMVGRLLADEPVSAVLDRSYESMLAGAEEIS